MRLGLLIGLVLSLSSCISIRVSDNSYRDLKEDQLTQLKQFSLDETDSVRNQHENLSLVEITGAEISSCLQKYPYTVVYLWKPFCKGPSCKPLFYYERIERKFRDRGVKWLIVSETYQFKLIKGNTEKSAYDRDLYVIKDSEYGHHTNAAKNAIVKEIAPSYAFSSIKNNADGYFVFKRNDLIYHGSEISEQIVDSILKNN